MEKKTSIFLIILLCILVAVLGGSVSYYFLTNAHDQETQALNDQADQLESNIAKLRAETKITELKSTETPTTTTITPTIKEVDPTADWKTYTDAHYNISFKYPKTWKTPTAGFNDASSGEDLLIPLSQQWVNFDESAFDKTVSANITNYTDLASYYSKGSESKTATSLDILKTVFKNKSATGAEKLAVFPINAATMAASAPTYIENKDAKWRGVYYFANIGQAYTTNLDCLIVMTDGASKVVQFHFMLPSDKASQYQATVEQENSSYVKYVNSLTSSSDETIVQNYKNIYQYIIKSLQNVS